MKTKTSDITSSFLSTFPRRERRFCCSALRHLDNFYPRSHVGNDFPHSGRSLRPADFYPRSHVGNDRSNSAWFPPCERFLSTFPRRERHFTGWPLSLKCAFLSTFPRRERRAIWSACARAVIFLSTFPRRERRKSSSVQI